MEKTVYLAALLHLQAQGRNLCDAFRGAAVAARALDPEGEQQPDQECGEIFVNLAAQLRALCEQVPGALEIFRLAVAQKEDLVCGLSHP